MVLIPYPRQYTYKETLDTFSVQDTFVLKHTKNIRDSNNAKTKIDCNLGPFSR